MVFAMIPESLYSVQNLAKIVLEIVNLYYYQLIIYLLTNFFFIIDFSNLNNYYDICSALEYETFGGTCADDELRISFCS
jgi:hypothetical protein